MKRLFSILLILSSFSVVAQSKSGYSIHFKIKGLQDTTIYLGYYYGETAYVRDTAQVNDKGEFTFNGKEALPQGRYFLVLKNARYLDILVGADQNFSLETDATDLAKNMVVKNSIDNKLFFESVVYSTQLRKDADPYIKILQDSTIQDENKRKEALEGYRKINDSVARYHNKLINEYPTTLAARLFKATKPVEIPNPPTRPDGSIDSTFQLRYYRAHFFDNFDLSDDALTRLEGSLYSKKVNEYLDKLYVPQVDTIMIAINNMVSLAKKNQDTYRFLIQTLTRKYETPEYMGLDEVFVQLYYKYYATGEMNSWANEKLRKNLKDVADRYCKSLIGKTAPNLMMQDANLQPRSLYDIKAKYTVIYFYDPDCGSCKKETPVLVDFYTKNKTRLNVEVFAVTSDSSLAKMRNYIKDMNMKWITVNGPRTYFKTSYHDQYDAISTPTIYVINEKKVIIAKKLPAARLEDFLINYEKIQKRKEAMVVKPAERIPFDCSKLAIKNPGNTDPGQK